MEAVFPTFRIPVDTLRRRPRLEADFSSDRRLWAPRISFPLGLETEASLWGEQSMGEIRSCPPRGKRRASPYRMALAWRHQPTVKSSRGGRHAPAQSQLTEPATPGTPHAERGGAESHRQEREKRCSPEPPPSGETPATALRVESTNCRYAETCTWLPSVRTPTRGMRAAT